MKFDPYNWNEASPNEKVQSRKGILRVRTSAPAPLYISAEGVEALAGYGTAFDVETSEAVIWRVDAPKGVRVFYEAPPRTSVAASGEVYTNIDRMPDESGNLAEVLRARRLFEIEQRAMLRDLRQERAALIAEREAAQQPASAPALAPAVEAEAEAAPADKAAK